MGDEEQRALVRGEGLFELLDRGQVEMVRRLVEHEAVDAAGHEQREHGPRALARRQRRPPVARRARRRGRTWRAASGPRSAAVAGRRHERVEERNASPANAAGPGRARRRRRRARSTASPRRAAAGRAARRAASSCRDPFAPRIATRSAQPISRSIGPSVNVAPMHDRVRRAARRRRRCGAPAATSIAELPALPRLVDRLEPLDGLLGDPAPSTPRFSDGSMRWWPDVLVLLARVVASTLAYSIAPTTAAACGPGRRAPPAGACTSRRPPRRAGARVACSSRYAMPAAVVSVTPPLVCSSSSSTDVMVRSRNARSCDTTMAPPASDVEERPRADRVRRSRGRSWARRGGRRRSATSRIAARAARAACPPDKCGHGLRRAHAREVRVRPRPPRLGRRGRRRRERATARARASRRRRPQSRPRPNRPSRPRATSSRRPPRCAAPGTKRRSHRFVALAPARGSRSSPTEAARRTVPRVGLQQARDHAQQGRLARAVRRNDADP